MTRSCAFSVQVEILNSYHQTLHKLHGEQVEARPSGGGRRWGIGTLEYSTAWGGAMCKRGCRPGGGN